MNPPPVFKRPFWKHWGFWLPVCLIGLILIFPTRPSKVAWKDKASRHFSLVGNQLVAETKPFVERMGKPQRIQSIHGTVIWYYHCSDGEFQLVMFADPAYGSIIADVNER